MSFKIGGKRDLVAKLAKRAEPPQTAQLQRDAQPLSTVCDASRLMKEAARVQSYLLMAAESCSVKLEHNDAKGRFVVATRGFKSGEVVLSKKAFAWLDYKAAHGDDRAYISLLHTTHAASFNSTDLIARFLCLVPNVRADGSCGIDLTDASTVQRLRAEDIVLPAIHKNGFQAELPPLPADAHEACILSNTGTRNPDGSTSLELFLLLPAMSNHSCEPNVRYEVEWAPLLSDVSAAQQHDESSSDATSSSTSSDRDICYVPQLSFVATRDIAAGEEVCHSYVDPTADVEDRRVRLRAGYGFACNCAKCERELALALHAQMRAHVRPASSGYML